MRVTGFARATLHFHSNFIESLGGPRLRIYANIKNMKTKKGRIPQLRYTETRLAANAVKNTTHCLIVSGKKHCYRFNEQGHRSRVFNQSALRI